MSQSGDMLDDAKCRRWRRNGDSDPVPVMWLAQRGAKVMILSQDTSHVSLNLTPVRALVRRAPVTLSPDVPILEAARLMRRQGVSSVLLVENGALVGIVTDRDLRNRVVAEALDTSLPVHRIATVRMITIGADRPAFHALLLMARHGLHHLPVLNAQDVLGMVTSDDLAEYQAESALTLASAMGKQDALDELVRVAARIGGLQQGLTTASASPYSTGQIVSTLTDTLTARLLHLAEARFGPAPVPYAWVAAGSQGRAEQTAKSDQDNCLILSDRYDSVAHGAYFAMLARWVCDGLDACGYVHCPGGMMAMNDEWRQPLATWRGYFQRWIEQPEPEALMLSGVFLDMRFVHGDAALVDDLRADVIARAQANKAFLAALAALALHRKPPLNWRGKLALGRDSEHPGTIDLKMHGIVPIVDIARYYAFSAGSDAVNSRERLEQTAERGRMSQAQARDLLDALDFLSGLRLRHQALCMADGRAADNFLNPDELSNFERSHLLEAFRLIGRMQDVVAQAYPVNLL